MNELNAVHLSIECFQKVPRFWLCLYSSTDLAILKKSTRDQICKDLYRFYDFCNDQNYDLDLILGELNVFQLKRLLTQFYVDNLNLKGLSLRRVGDIWKALKNFILTTLSKIQPFYTSKLSTKLDPNYWDIEEIESLYKQLRAPKRGANNSIRALSDKAITEILNVVTPSSSKNPFRERNQLRNQILILLMLTMGLRTSECLALTGGSLIYENDMAWLKITYLEENLFDSRAEKAAIKNDFSHRIVPIPNFIHALLNEYLSIYRRTNKKNSFIFTSNQGKPLTARQLRYLVETVGNVIIKESKSTLLENFRAGGLSPHDLRHTAACKLLGFYYDESNNDMESALVKLREFMGWSPESEMPMRYARLYLHDASSRAAIKSIDLRFGGDSHAG